VGAPGRAWLATCSAAVLKNLDAWLANREIRRRTRVVGAFPDGQSALNLAAARLRHIAGTRWSTRRYLDMILLYHEALQTA
jgi:transposase-like protein